MNELMEGITIISENKFYAISGSMGAWIIVLTIICIITLLIGLNGTINKIKSISMIISGISIISIIICFAVPPEIEIMQYKVLISDNVNLKDFTQKYEIINIDGEIYTIGERKVDQ